MVVQTKAHRQRVRLSLDLPMELHTALKVTAARRRLSMSDLVRQLLENALAVLGDSSTAYEDLDSLAIRRELAAASVAALGDFWDKEVDAQWQNFQP